MTQAYFDQLLGLEEAQFQLEQAKMQGILDEESVIRSSIAQFEDNCRRARDAQVDASLAQGAFGGDVLWQRWVMRMRRDLQIELAQVLARKATMMRALAQAHGRKLSSQNLVNEARTTQIATKQKIQNGVLQDLFILQQDTGENGR